MKRSERVAVVGLGRMGLPTACIAGARGYDVTGVDRDADVRTCIQFRDLPYDEPGLDLGALELAQHISEVEAEVWVIAVGTTHDGRLDDSAVLELVKEVRARPSTRLILIESTISPSTAQLLPTEVMVAVCPERARPGHVLSDFATFPRAIGGRTEAATQAALTFYRTLTDAPLHGCSAAEAALAKLAENAEREVRIAFANELADVARQFEVDPSVVTSIANTHPRTNLLTSGIGVGGHCLPMATRWFAARSEGVAKAARAMHDERPFATARRITQALEPGAKVCVIGRTYRPNTAYHQPADDSDPYASPAVALISALRELGFEVSSWDPSDEDGTRAEAEAGADLVFVAVPHDTL